MQKAGRVQEHRWLRHRMLNTMQSLILVAAMAGLTGLLAWLLGGVQMAVFAVAVIFVLVFIQGLVSPEQALRLFHGRRISDLNAPRLYAVVRALAERAQLPATPILYYLPEDIMNAFSIGSPRHAVIVVSDGLLQRLSLREATAVIAHEMGHIRHNDLRAMGLADMFSRITTFFSIAGQILLIVSLPLILLTDVQISWLSIVILIFAPTLSALLQLALSRVREYEADLEAVRLTGDVHALISALAKMETYQRRLLGRIFLPDYRRREPALLRTHPATEARIRRLMELEAY